MGRNQSTFKDATFKDATTARHAYRRADVPMIGGMDGDWRIEFIGNPRWLDLLPKVQRLLGLHKLFGLRIRDAHAVHLVGKPKRLDECKPLHIHMSPSSVDDGRAARMVSAPGNGRLWDLFASEVRVLSPDTLIGVDLVGLADRVVPMPFVLHRHDES